MKRQPLTNFFLKICHLLKVFLLSFHNFIGKDDEAEKEKEKLSWNFSMSELDRFFEQVRCLNPRPAVPDENIEFSDNNMLQHTSTFTQLPTKYVNLLAFFIFQFTPT